MRQLLSFLIALLLMQSACGQDSIRFLGATSGAASANVLYHNDYLYAGNGATFAVYDVSPGQTPPYTEVFRYRFRSKIDDLKIHDDDLYIAANNDGISRWDLTNPASPIHLYSYEPDQP